MLPRLLSELNLRWILFFTIFFLYFVLFFEILTYFYSTSSQNPQWRLKKKEMMLLSTFCTVIHLSSYFYCINITRIFCVFTRFLHLELCHKARIRIFIWLLFPVSAMLLGDSKHYNWLHPQFSSKNLFLSEWRSTPARPSCINFFIFLSKVMLVC